MAKPRISAQLQESYVQLIEASTPDLKRFWWEMLKSYVQQRTRRQIRAMEKKMFGRSFL